MMRQDPEPQAPTGPNPARPAEVGHDWSHEARANTSDSGGRLDRREYEPIEPNPPTRTDLAVAEVLVEVTGLGKITRCTLGGLAFLGAWPFLLAAYAVGDVNHWSAWTVSIGILEPLGLMCIVGSVFLVKPNAPLAKLLVWTAIKGRAVIFGIFLATIGWIVGGLVVIAFMSVTTPGS